MNYIQNNEGVNSEIYNYCKDDINEDFLKELNKTYNDDSKYKVISEGYFRRGGINLWNSNNYQNELINEYKKSQE